MKMNRGVLAVYQGIDMEEMPTTAHRELLERRRRDAKRKLNIPSRLVASILPQRTIKSVKRAGIGESWYDQPPADIIAAFPNLTNV